MKPAPPESPAKPPAKPPGEKVTVNVEVAPGQFSRMEIDRSRIGTQKVEVPVWLS